MEWETRWCSSFARGCSNGPVFAIELGPVHPQNSAGNLRAAHSALQALLEALTQKDPETSFRMQLSGIPLDDVSSMFSSLVPTVPTSHQHGSLAPPSEARLPPPHTHTHAHTHIELPCFPGCQGFGMFGASRKYMIVLKNRPFLTVSVI